MNIIIVGCGNVGSTLAEKLRNENHDIVIIDKSRARVEQITDEQDILGVVGDGLNYQILQKAGIEHTDLLIAVTDSDEQNLLCCVMAKRSGQYCRTIARVRNPIYSAEISYLRRELGLSLIINPELIAAADIARKFQYPDTIRIETFTRGRIELLHVRVEENSPLNGLEVGNFKTHFKCNVLICVIERSRRVFVPSPECRLTAGDELVLSATPKEANQFLKKIGLYTHPLKSAMIAGGGTVGFYLTKRLTEVGVRTKIIEADPERCTQLNDEIPKAIIINGDASDERLLLREGIGGAGAFAALTGIDEENVLLSLFSKRVSHAKTITKLRRLNYTEVMENIRVDDAVFPSLLTADYITKYARSMLNIKGSNVENAFQLFNGRATALEFFITEESPVTGTPLSRLKLKEGLLICSITRNDRLIVPTGREDIRVGDSILIITVADGFHDIKDIIVT
ncbi:MAG: Trk system potassium transporter TrkA [Lachnospiraceae bacterium]|nr:Trk system potassium transporter TrkA [Lachnospiraceae bacterium]